MHETVSSLRGRGTETKKEGETKRRGMRDEGRRGGQVKKEDIERSKEPTGGEILKSYRKVGSLGSVSGKKEERTLTTLLAVSDGNHSPLPCSTRIQSHCPFPDPHHLLTCTEAFWSPPGCYTPPSCRSAQKPEETPARKASAPGAHGNETHLPHAASMLSTVPALAQKTRATL